MRQPTQKCTSQALHEARRRRFAPPQALRGPPGPEEGFLVLLLWPPPSKSQRDQEAAAPLCQDGERRSSLSFGVGVAFFLPHFPWHFPWPPADGHDARFCPGLHLQVSLSASRANRALLATVFAHARVVCSADSASAVMHCFARAMPTRAASTQSEGQRQRPPQKLRLVPVSSCAG